MQLVDIKDHWQAVNTELTSLYIRDNKRGVTDWIPEDVYAACLYGYAKLYQCDDGYFVFKMNGSEFVVWFALSINHSGKDLMEHYFGETCEIAENAQAETMAFYTTRKGYDRVINNGGLVGFKFQHSKYVREV